MISENLKKIRGFKGMSKQDLSDKSGVNPVTIWKIENGKGNPSLNTLERLAQSLEVDVGIFFVNDLNFTKEVG